MVDRDWRHKRETHRWYAWRKLESFRLAILQLVHDALEMRIGVVMLLAHPRSSFKITSDH